ncbi:hypothetical protein ACQJBY_045563 [Aegilops geniculata]
MTPEPRPWADLSCDLLLDISGRLHDVIDIVRFHAVCKPWRATSGQRSPAAWPWILGLSNNNRIIHCAAVNLASPCKTLSDRDFDLEAPLPGTSSYGGRRKSRNWVGRADGMNACIFVMGPEPRLVDLYTGAVTPLRPLPELDDETKRSMENVHGIVYGDGTVFLYSSSYTWRSVFTAAILRPGDAAWTVMKMNPKAGDDRDSCTAYHGGKVLLDMGMSSWRVVTQEGLGCSVRCDPIAKFKHVHVENYVLESRGKLLWVSVHADIEWYIGISGGSYPDMWVMVQALEEEAGGENMRWATMDTRSLGDRVLFLGYPTSFAMDSCQLSMDGGCAYFVFQYWMLRYRFDDGETEGVMYHPLTRTDAHVWLRPQPPIAPMTEIQERLEARSK